jgi:hypothetical protein
VTSSEGSTTATKQGGLFEDLIEVLYAPSVVFERTRATKAIKYVLATTVIVAIILIATKNLLLPWFEAQADLGLKLAAAKGKEIPEAAAASARSFSSWGIVIGAPLTMLIGPYINAIFLLIGAKLMKVNASYAQLATVATLSGVPRIIAWIALPVQALVLDGASARSLADLSFGPARFLDPMSVPQPVLTLLSNLDVFRLWQIAAIAIGVAVVGRVTKGTGAVVAIIMFGLSAALQLIPSALF